MSARTAQLGQRAMMMLALALTLMVISAFSARSALAHCDGLDGPVVASAQRALQTGDINHVLIWVRPEDDSQIRAAFGETLVVRSKGPEAQALSDRYFFETLVRIHRAGEGAPYTGLKPAGRDLGPAIPAADRAIATGSEEALLQLLIGEVQEGLSRRFKELSERKKFAPDDVSAGREYVESYVTFIHYVEQLHEAAEGPVEGHYNESN